MEENELLQNEFEWNSEDILDLIATGASGRDPDYPNRPNTGAGDMHTLDDEGNYVDPNKPGVENVSAAYEQWVEEAAAYGVENLSTRDQILYAQSAYRLGAISAEEAQTIYDPAFEQHMQDRGFEFDEKKGQWKDENLRSQADGEKGVVDYYTPIDFSEASTGFEDFDGTWINNEWDTEREVVNTSFVSKYFKVGIAIGAGIITGGAAASLVSGLPGWIGGAVKGAVGSATSQGVMNGKIDPSSLIQATLLGAVGGLAKDLADMDASIFEDATNVTGKADEIVSGLSDMLEIPYDEALGIAKGIADGVITGDSIAGIVANAAGSYTTTKTMQYLKDTYGDQFDVEDWFKEDGSSNIPVEALRPIIGGTVQGAIDGEVNKADMFKMLWDYHEAGGDLDFMLPDLPELAGEEGILPKWLADISIDKGSDWTYTENEDGSVNITWDEDIIPDVELPEVDIDLPEFELPEVDIDLPEFELPEIDIDLPEFDLPEVDIDLPDVDLPDIDLPELPELPEFEGPDIEGPDIEGPDLDLDLDVDLPSVPSLDFDASGSTMDAQGLFDYTTIKPQEAAKLTPYVDYVQKARGMLS